MKKLIVFIFSVVLLGSCGPSGIPDDWKDSKLYNVKNVRTRELNNSNNYIIITSDNKFYLSEYVISSDQYFEFEGAIEYTGTANNDSHLYDMIKENKSNFSGDGVFKFIKLSTNKRLEYLETHHVKPIKISPYLLFYDEGYNSFLRINYEYYDDYERVWKTERRYFLKTVTRNVN